MGADDNGLVGLADAAKRLGVSTRTLRRWMKDGKLKAHSMVDGPYGKQYMFDPDALAATMAKPVSAPVARVGGSHDSLALVMSEVVDVKVQRLYDELAALREEIRQMREMMVAAQQQPQNPERAESLARKPRWRFWG